MTTPEPRLGTLHDDVRAALPSLVTDVRRMVESESPSRELGAVAASAETVASVGRDRLGVPPERIVIDGCTHLRWRLGSGDGPRVLLLGHHDTVWPLGTVSRLPFSVTSGTMRGPGCFDMKTGIAMALCAAAPFGPDANITVLITGDEEIGSPSSRSLIEAEARAATAVLVLEGADESGAVKIARKGAATYRVDITGRAAHAGLAPERGINATVELAHQISAVHRLAQGSVDTTITPTLAGAGTTTNTVAAEAHFFVDVRTESTSAQERVDRELHALQPCLPGATVAVTRRPLRPPMTESASAPLFAAARDIASRLGMGDLEGRAVGGASDGNLTAGIGVPTLDGLGAVGGGAHAEDEHVLVDRLPDRVALLAGLIAHTLAATGTGEARDATSP